MVSIMLSLFPEDTKQPKSLEDTKRDLEKFIDSTINEVSSEKINYGNFNGKLLSLPDNIEDFWRKNYKNLKILTLDKETEDKYKFKTKESLEHKVYYGIWVNVGYERCTRGEECSNINPYVRDLFTVGQTRWQQIEKELRECFDGSDEMQELLKDSEERIEQVARMVRPTSFSRPGARYKETDLCLKCHERDIDLEFDKTLSRARKKTNV